jgi:hypothetical protein
MTPFQSIAGELSYDQEPVAVADQLGR